MASITLKYNARNRMAQKTIDYILSLGIFETIRPQNHFAESGADITRRTVEEVERGEIIHCGSYENYLKLTGDHA